jgi:CelD/BcsL family acetyltransferase involved in cellulose biosynthesis
MNARPARQPLGHVPLSVQSTAQEAALEGSGRGEATLGATTVQRQSVPSVVTVDPLADARWVDLVSRRSGSLFQSPPWLRALRDTYGFDLRADLVVEGDGDATAGIVYSPIQDLMDDRVVSLPFSDYCDPLVDSPGSWEALTAGLVRGDHRLQLRCLRETAPLADDRFTVTGRARWHEVVVEPDGDERWHAVHSTARRAIRKARDEGVTVTAARDEADLRAFFDLHLRVRKHKYRLLAQPYGFFLALWDGFLRHGQGALLLARRGGSVVAGVLYLGWGDTLYYKFNASDPAHLDARPNDLIVWESLAYAADHGYRSVDFGLSDWDQEGLNRFKRKYATDERTIHLLRHDPGDGPSGSELEARRLLDRLTGVFVGAEVPDHVTAEAGDALYRYFV